ncbi:MAG TPA: transporter substrate-binding domain-containing protein, partial [Pseudomonas sp.]|nr:transporter substrate-binding domain-containing protein [Pseudomonas sp.]
MGNRRFANWLTGAACVLLAGMSAAQAQPIRFAVAAEPYPPYTEKQANGEWKGFEVDLIHKLCSEMKADCEIKEVAWDGIIPSLLAKKIDVIFSSMSVTEEREKQIAFSKAYYDSAIAVVGPKDVSVKKYPDDLKGKIIGVQNSTVSASYL